MKNDACPFLLTRQVLDENEWTPDRLEQRQDEVLRSLAMSWEIETQYEAWKVVGGVI